MQKNSLWKRDGSVLRVLDERENEMLVIDCIHPVMPTWVRKDELLHYTQIEESELWPASNGISREDDIPVEAQRIMRERFTIITGVIPYIMDKGKRSQMIARAAAEHGVCRKTVRHYLCLYLAYQDVAVLAPQSGAVEKALTEYEKNIRWALNKFYYTKNRNSLRTAYTLMLKERYCDEGGNLLPEYPSFHVVNSKNGKALVGSLTQLINCSGISICMVGTPDSCQFFEQAMQLARRSLGLHYSELPYDRYFREFCEVLFGYQYVRNRTEITEAVIEWLYEHSAGVISIVVSLIHDAQEIAILNGRETLDIVALSEAYQRMQMIHSYVKPAKPRASQVSKPKKPVPVAEAERDSISSISIVEIVDAAKNGNRSVVDALREHFRIEEVAV